MKNIPPGWKISQDNGKMYCPDHFEEFEALLNISQDVIDAHSYYLLCQAYDCPQIVARQMFGIRDTSSTRILLGEMLSRWKPKLWIFGHHHISKRLEMNNTNFVCLAELEIFDSKDFFK